MIGCIFAFNGLKWRDGMNMKGHGGTDYVYRCTIDKYREHANIRL